MVVNNPVIAEDIDFMVYKVGPEPIVAKYRVKMEPLQIMAFFQKLVLLGFKFPHF